MNDRERLVQWMHDNGYTNSSLGALTGDSRHTIYYMTRGARVVNKAFKWRFKQAFGHEIADKLFPNEPENAVTPQTEVA